MAQMTEEEADALDELLTRTTPKLKTGEGGVFTRQQRLLSRSFYYFLKEILLTRRALHRLPRIGGRSSFIRQFQGPPGNPIGSRIVNLGNNPNGMKRRFYKTA
jgi:hypothetical protein